LNSELPTGSSWCPFYINPHKRVEARIEFARLPGNITDLRVMFLADHHLRTFMRRPVSAGLSFRIMAGFVTLQAHRDRWNVAEGSIGPIAEMGTLHSIRNQGLIGRRIIGGYWEHDLRSLLFEALRIRPLVGQNVSVRLEGAHVYIDEQWIHEATVSIARAPLRINFTRRMDQPEIFTGFGLTERR